MEDETRHDQSAFQEAGFADIGDSSVDQYAGVQDFYGTGRTRRIGIYGDHFRLAWSKMKRQILGFPNAYERSNVGAHQRDNEPQK